MAEKLDFGGDKEWKAREYYASDYADVQRGILKKRIGMPDAKQSSEAYRQNYDRIFRNGNDQKIGEDEIPATSDSAKEP